MENNTKTNDIAARYFFKNCTVSIHCNGNMEISKSLKPESDDIQLNRDFTPSGSPSEFIGSQSDFYKFLDCSSESNFSLIKKLGAIGYLLSNKLYRHPAMHRSYAFICVNEEKGGYCNGKSLFAKAISLFCEYKMIGPGNLNNHFLLEDVTETTQLVIVDGLTASKKVGPLLSLVTSDWVINRRLQYPLVIESERAPHLLLTSQAAVSELRKDNSFRRRFVPLEFSSYWSTTNRIDTYFGHRLFDDWDKEQWHLFDNFMFYCVTEYLQWFSKNKDIFSHC